MVVLDDFGEVMIQRILCLSLAIHVSDKVADVKNDSRISQQLLPQRCDDYVVVQTMPLAHAGTCAIRSLSRSLDVVMGRGLQRLKVFAQLNPSRAVFFYLLNVPAIWPTATETQRTIIAFNDGRLFDFNRWDVTEGNVFSCNHILRNLSG